MHVWEGALELCKMIARRSNPISLRHETNGNHILTLDVDQPYIATWLVFETWFCQVRKVTFVWNNYNWFIAIFRCSIMTAFANFVHASMEYKYTDTRASTFSMSTHLMAGNSHVTEVSMIWSSHVLFLKATCFTWKSSTVGTCSGLNFMPRKRLTREVSPRPETPNMATVNFCKYFSCSFTFSPLPIGIIRSCRTCSKIWFEASLTKS